MLLAVAWSVQGAEWLDGLDFLVPVAVLSVLAGTFIALSALRPSAALPLGALAGGSIVIWTVGGEYFPAFDHLGRLLSLRAELVAWLQAVVYGGYPVELSPYALGLGMLLWVTGFTSAYAVFRRHRAVDAVLVAGAALVANMAATYSDLFEFLVLFVAAALLLLLRVSLADRQLSWRARRVSETDEGPITIMPSGLIFDAGSVALAWVLTRVAVGAPLGNAWRHLDTVWSGVSRSLDRILGTVENSTSRLGSAGYGSEMPITATWVSRDDVALLVAADQAYYLRATAYDVYTGRTWQHSAPSLRGVPAEEPLFPAESLERPIVPESVRRVTITVGIESPNGRALYTPGYPVRAYLPTLVHDIGSSALFGALEASSPINPGDGYQISADVSIATQAQLAAAGTAYPPEISALYLGTEAMSEETRQLARQIVSEAGATDPYRQADALASYLNSSPLFTYDTDVSLPGPGQGDAVHFFLFDAEGRRGFCQQFASSMVLMARSLGIPARLAVGYAPGEPSGEPGVYVVRQSDAHAWAELYFPGYGWQVFEATRSINPSFSRPPGEPPAGAGGASAPPRVGDPRDDDDLGAVSVLPTWRPGEGARDVTATPVADRARGGNALVFVFLALVAAGGVFYLSRRAERRWALLLAGDQAWRRLERTAERAGVRPRPHETPYEYATWLGEQIPSRRPEIETLADGKVWTDYSGRRMPSGRQAIIRRAWERLRLPLWTLVARRRLSSLVSRSSPPRP